MRKLLASTLALTFALSLGTPLLQSEAAALDFNPAVSSTRALGIGDGIKVNEENKGNNNQNNPPRMGEGTHPSDDKNNKEQNRQDKPPKIGEGARPTDDRNNRDKNNEWKRQKGHGPQDNDQYRIGEGARPKKDDNDNKRNKHHRRHGHGPQKRDDDKDKQFRPRGHWTGKVIHERESSTDSSDSMHG